MKHHELESALEMGVISFNHLLLMNIGLRTFATCYVWMKNENLSLYEITKLSCKSADI